MVSLLNFIIHESHLSVEFTYMLAKFTEK